jgi:hypothetical protein
MRDCVLLERILVGAPYTFRAQAIVEGKVMHLVARVEALHHLERTDLPATCRRMEKVAFDPKNLHVAELFPKMVIESVGRIPIKHYGRCNEQDRLDMLVT